MVDKAGIYIDLYKLRKLLKRAQYMMCKTDRIIYGTPILQANADCLRCFVMAYDYIDERPRYIREMLAHFEVMKIDLRIIIEDNIIKCPDPENVAMKVDTMKFSILELVGRIDEGMTKWRLSNEKGKTATE